MAPVTLTLLKIQHRYAAVTRLILILMALTAFISSVKATAELDNYIAAIVNESIITFQDVRDASRKSIGALEQIYLRRPELLREKQNTVMTEALEALVAKVLIVDEFKTSVGAVPENMLDNQISQQIRKDFVDRQNFRKSLRQEGISYEKYRKMVHDDMVVRFMMDRNVRSAIIISPQKIESYYTNHLQDYKMDNQVKLRMIVLTEKSAPTMAEVKKLGLEVVSRVEAGTSFAEMASVYSEGSEKRQGGDWGWIDKSKLRKGLSDVAFTLEKGQRSGLIARAPGEGEAYSIYQFDKNGNLVMTKKYSDKEQLIEEKDVSKDPAAAAALPEPQEFYLILVEEKEVSRTRTLAEVKDEIEKNLIVQERARLQKQWIDRLKAKAFVRYPGT